MNTTQKLHQTRLNEWAIRCKEQRDSGLTVRKWCEENQLSFHTFNYWKHLLKSEVVDQMLPDIVPITLPASVSECTIRTNRTNSTIRTNSNLVKFSYLAISSIHVSVECAVGWTFLIYKVEKDSNLTSYNFFTDFSSQSINEVYTRITGQVP